MTQHKPGSCLLNPFQQLTYEAQRHQTQEKVSSRQQQRFCIPDIVKLERLNQLSISGGQDGAGVISRDNSEEEPEPSQRSSGAFLQRRSALPIHNLNMIKKDSFSKTIILKLQKLQSITTFSFNCLPDQKMKMLREFQ